MSMEARTGPVGAPELEHLRNLLQGFARRLERQHPTVDREELLQIGIATALTLRDRYDPSRGATFTTFAFRFAKRAMLSFVKRIGCLVLEPRERDELQPSYEEEVLEAESTRERERLVQRVLSEFDPRDRALLLRVDGAGESLVDVAESLRLVYRHAHYRIQKARPRFERRMRAVLGMAPLPSERLAAARLG